MKKIKSIKTFAQYGEAPESLISYEERNEQEGIIQEEYYYQDGNLEQATVRVFDAENRVLEEKQYTEEGDPDHHAHFSYANSGKLSSIKTEYKDGSFSIKSVERNEADQSVTIQTVDDEDFLESKEYQRFDSNGNVVEEAIYGEEAVFQERKLVQYDDHGRTLKLDIEYSDGFKKTLHYIYQVNDQGTIDQLQIVDNKKQLVRKDNYVYNDKGNKIEHHIVDKDRGMSAAYEWEYDEKDRMIVQTIVRPNGEIIEKQVTEYDELDAIVKITTSTQQGDVVKRYEYEYFD